MSLLGTADLGVAFTGDIGDLLRASSQAGNSVDGFGKKAGGALRDVTKEARQTDDAMGRLANGIKSAFVGSSVAVGLVTLKNQVVSVVGALTDAQVQLDRIKNGFSFGAGGAAAGAREMAFVRSEADRLGLALNSTATNYMKMVAASRGNKMAGEQTRELFMSIAEASVVMGMGQDQTERSMSAVVQMMSKGKVMAEELRGQLGEHLPGAFAIAARAMGVTEVELNKMMETGSVLSEDFLPRFAAQLRKELAGSVEQSALSMQANLNRLSTAWLDFKQQVVQGGVGEQIGSQTKNLSTEISILGDVLEASRQRGDGFWETMGNVAGAATGRVAFQVLQDTANGLNGVLNFTTLGLLDLNTSLDLVPDNLKPVAEQMELTAAKVKAAEAEYAALSARLAQAPDNIYIKSELGNLARYIDTLRIAQGEQRKLMGMGSGSSESMGSVGSGDAALARAQRADYDKRKALLGDTLKKYATDDEKYATEAKRLKEALGDLYSPDLDKRIRDNFIKPSRAAKKEVDDFQKVLDRVTAKDSGLDPSFYKDLNTLHAGYKAGRIDIDEYRVAVEMLVTNQKFAKDAVKEHADAVQAAAQSNNAAWDAEFEALEKKRLSNEAQIKTGRETLAQIQFETSLLGMNTLQREQAIAMRDLENKSVKAGEQAYNAYAEAIQKALADRAAQQQQLEFWKDVDSTAKNVFMDLAENGEDAFKRIGNSIERFVLEMLYEITVKKWIIQIAGQYGGALGGGTNWIDLATKAYQAYSGGGGGLASLFGGGGAAAAGTSAYGSSYAAGSVSSSAMVSTGGSSAAGGSSSAMMGYMSYAALIAAAVMIAENLYSKGYTRMALGQGGSETARFGQYSSYNTDPNTQRAGAMQNSPAMLMTNDMRKFNDALGMSGKWADILSGTTRMATLVGRKLSAYGYQADIAGGDASVSGFARYKGGVLRSNKTVAADIDPRDAAAFDAVVESTIEGSRAMARAMGYSDEAISAYTGSLKVNFKGAKTAEEQSQRMAEAMDNLNFELLKTASGGKLAREDFKAMMEGIQQDIEGAGISAQGMTDIVAGGIMNGLSGEEIGAQLSQMILGGIVNTFAQQAFAPVAQAMMTQIITPIFTAIAAGIPISQAVSKASISGMLTMANQAMEALNAIFNSAEMQAFFASLNEMFKGIGGSVGGVKIPKIPGIKPINPGVDETKREKEQLEREILRLQGNTVELRRRELLEIKPGNRALQQRVWALEDEKKIMDERRSLERELLELQGNTNALRALERAALDESNRALYDQIKALEDAEKLKDTWSGVIDAMTDEVKRLREEILGSTPEGRAFAEAEFAMATAQARAGDKEAADRLPDLARNLLDIAGETSGSLGDLRAVQGSTLASLEETRRILGANYGAEAPKPATPHRTPGLGQPDMGRHTFLKAEALMPNTYTPAVGGDSSAELVAEVRALRADIRAASGLEVTKVANLGRIERLLDQVTSGGSFMRSREVQA